MVRFDLWELTRAAATPGTALTVAYERKIRKSFEECRRQGVAFIPLAVERLVGSMRWPSGKSRSWLLPCQGRRDKRSRWPSSSCGNLYCVYTNFCFRENMK